MFVLRRGVVRRLCAWSLRPYCSSEAGRELTSEGEGDGSEQPGLKDHIRARSRARVEGRLKEFLEICEPFAECT